MFRVKRTKSDDNRLVISLRLRIRLRIVRGSEDAINAEKYKEGVEEASNEFLAVDGQHMYGDSIM